LSLRSITPRTRRKSTGVNDQCRICGAQSSGSASVPSIQRAGYVFSVVGTARCAVPVAERSVRRRNRMFQNAGFNQSVPPAERGRGHRSAMSLPLNGYRVLSSAHPALLRLHAFFFTSATQIWLSRYHWTVSRMPCSKVCAGTHPSSFCIFDASIA